MKIRDYIAIVERNGQVVDEAKNKSYNKNRAAVASLRRLLAQAGAEWEGSMFQLGDVERLGLRADFDRAKAAAYIVQKAYPDWYEPTERGLIALKTQGMH